MILQSLFARDFRFDRVPRQLPETFQQNLRVKLLNWLRFNVGYLWRLPVPGIGACEYRRVWQAVIVVDRGPVRSRWRERDRPFEDQRLAGWGGRQGRHAFDGLSGASLGNAGRGPQRFQPGQCAVGGDFQAEPDLARVFSRDCRSHHAAHLLAPRVAVSLAVLQGVLAGKRPFVRCRCGGCRLGRRLRLRDGCRRRVLLPCLGCNDRSGRNWWCL